MFISKYIAIGHLTLNYLTNIINLVISSSKNYNIDVLSICETWLTFEIGDSFINIADYKIRQPWASKKHGVAMYVNMDIGFDIINSCVKNVVIIYLLHLFTYLFTAYRPPSYSHFENNSIYPPYIEN